MNINIRKNFPGTLKQRIKTRTDDNSPELRPASHFNDMTPPHRAVTPNVTARHYSEHASPQQTQRNPKNERYELVGRVFSPVVDRCRHVPHVL